MGGAVAGVIVEAGAGDAGNADFFYEMMGEGAVVGEAEGGDVGHDVVSAAGAIAVESGVFQDWHEMIATG